MKCIRVCALVAVTVSCCFGFGGFSATASFPGFGGLNQDLTELNHTWHGADSFEHRAPLWWVGGHGAAFVEDVTVGGRGAVAFRSVAADSLGSEFLGLTGFVEVGYRYAPVDYAWVRPCLDLGGGVWTLFVHSHDSFSQPNFSRWYLAWTMGAAPGLELMGRLRYRSDNYVGLFVKGSYFLPFHGPSWGGDDDPPEFSLKGFNLHLGLRFGKMPVRAFRI